MPRSCFVNVGANMGSGGFRAPIYGDGTFVYAPIPEEDVTVNQPTYADLGIESEAIPAGKLDTVVHFDPEVPEYNLGTAYTYGDKDTKASRISTELGRGDYLFFYATLESKDDATLSWIHPYWGVYLIGHFQLAADPIPGDDFGNLDPSLRDQLVYNAHVRRNEFDADVLVVGDPNTSQLYSCAVPLSVAKTWEGDKYPQPNQLARQGLTSLDQTTDYGSSPWYRWLMVSDDQGTDQFLRVVEQFQNDNGEQAFGLGAGPEQNLLEAANDIQGRAFDQFMRNKDFSTPPQHIRKLQDLFDEEGWLPETEHALLASFAYISGGWTDAVSKKVLNDLEITSLREAKEAVEQGWLAVLEDEEVYANHGHREAWDTGITTNAEKTPQAFETFHDKVAIDGVAIQSFTQFIFELQAKRCALVGEDRTESEVRSELFETARESLASVKSFGDLTQFDWLEVLVRAHGFDWLAPTALKPGYLKTGGGPRRGFKQLFGTDLDAGDANNYLTVLYEYGQQFAIKETNLIFTLESCLCQFQDLDKDEIAELAGEKGEHVSTDSGHVC